MIGKLVLLGVLQVTSYRPTPAQTKPECRDRWHCETSIGDGITKYGVAVSQDMLKTGEVHYGDILCIDNYGCRVVNDCMGDRARRAIDLLVFTRTEEKAVGVRHLEVYLLKKQKSLGGTNELQKLRHEDRDTITHGSQAHAARRVHVK